MSKKKASLYAHIAAPWLRLGYTVTPSTEGKHPLIAGWTDWHHPGSPLPGRKKIREWNESAWIGKKGEKKNLPRACLLLGGGSERPQEDGRWPLVVVDVDRLEHLDWAIATYGDTPLRVSTGREGGGVHLYYRMPIGADGRVIPVQGHNGIVGPDGSAAIKPGKDGHPPTTSTGIDVKATGNQVMCPGSVHQSGLVYTIRWCGDVMPTSLLTADHILAIPCFDIEIDKREKALGKARRAEALGKTPRVQGSDHRPARDPAVGGSGRIDPDTIVVGRDGSSYKIESYEGSCHSPFRADTHPSCSVFVGASGDRMLYDHATSETWVVRTTAPEGLDTNRLSVEEWSPDWGHQTPQKKSESLKYLRDPKKNYLPPNCIDAAKRLVCVAAPQGAGKTHRLTEDVVRPVLGRGGTVLVITHRRSLASILSTRMGLTDYRELKGAITPEPGQGYVVCLDSLPRVETDTPENPYDHFSPLRQHRWDVVILDEAVSVVDHLFGGTVAKAGVSKVWRSFVAHLRPSIQVIAADADLRRCPLIVDCLRESMGGVPDEDVQTISFTPARSSRRAVYYAKIESLQDRMQDELMHGQRWWAYCSSKADATALHVHMSTVFGEQRRGMLISAETSASEEVQAVYADPALLEAYDWVISTPSCETALSYDGDRFDRTYGLIRGFTSRNKPGTTALACYQGLCRVRHPKDDTLHLWVGGSPSSTSTDPAEIVEMMQQCTDWTRRALKLAPTDPDYRKIVRQYARATANRAEWGNELRDLHPESEESELLAKEAKKLRKRHETKTRHLADAQENLEKKHSDAQAAASEKDKLYKRRLAKQQDEKVDRLQAEIDQLATEAERIEALAAASRPEPIPGAMTRLLTELGYEVTYDITPAQAPGAFAGLKERIRDQEIAEVVAAPIIDPETAAHVLDDEELPKEVETLCRRELSPMDFEAASSVAVQKLARQAAQRSLAVEFYGWDPREVTAEQIERDNQGRHRAKTRSYATMRLLAKKEAHLVEDADREEAQRDMFGCRRRVAWWKAVKAVMVAYGIDTIADGTQPKTDDEITVLDRKRLNQLARWAQINFGIDMRVRSDKPLAALSSVLGSIGLRLVKSESGARVIAGCAAMDRDSAAYLARVRRGDIRSLHIVDVDHLLDGIDGDGELPELDEIDDPSSPHYDWTWHREVSRACARAA